MRKFAASTLLSTTMLIAPIALAHAGDDQNSGEHAKHHEVHSHDGMMGKAGMREHMDQMKQIMNRIQNTDDPVERQELMTQHRQQMHQAMRSMCKSMGGGEKVDGGNGGGRMGMMDMDPEMRRQMMQEHLQMMENVMEQMEAHMQADQSMKNAR